jgi:hypothetical protein
MRTLENLPRIGTPEAVTQFLNAHRHSDIPPRFADFLVSHLQAAHGFKDDAEVQQVVGSFILSAPSKTQVRQALDCVNQALTKGLTADVAKHYEMLKIGFDNICSGPDLVPTSQILKDLNAALHALATAVDSGESIELYESELCEALDKFGVIFPKSDYSLLIKIDPYRISTSIVKTLENWGLTGEIFTISVAPPLRESTGTHGSGERQKLTESIQTVSLDWDVHDKPLIKVNLWGRYSGLYNRLEEALTLPLPVNAISSFELEASPNWLEMLTRAANNIVNSHAARRWPDFVQQQVERLEKLRDQTREG